MRECVKCKSNEYTNKSLVMMINECGHPLCRNCVDNLYARNAAPCHICGRVLRKNNFWEQTFDDPIVEKENHIRKRIRKVYNLREDDFPSLKEYNDFLERVEMLVMNLAQDIDVEEYENEIRQFQEAHSEQIERNRKRLDPDQLWVQQQLKEEKAMKQRLAEVTQSATKDNEKLVVRDTKDIMKELRESNVAAEVILDRERKRQIEIELEEKEEAERKKKIKKERKRGDGLSFALGPVRVAGRPFEHQHVLFELNGPSMIDIEEIEKMGYLQFMRMASPHRQAGGYTATIGCYRALLEARMDLEFGLLLD